LFFWVEAFVLPNVLLAISLFLLRSLP
jgi:hypothetical protein